MSLRGKIFVENTDTVGGFTAAVNDLKKAASTLIGKDISDSARTSDSVWFEGIVQGDIKMQAVSDWKTTLYHGLSDAAGNVTLGSSVGGGTFKASGVFKFANTVMNTLGYTLGGTGPASRKMYGGSNLQGFSVQFKWYTPYMTGWAGAIQSLSYLAWPIAGSGTNESPEAMLTQADVEAKKAGEDNLYKAITERCLAHLAAIKSALLYLDIAATIADQTTRKDKFWEFDHKNFEDLSEWKNTVAQELYTGDNPPAPDDIVEYKELLRNSTNTTASVGKAAKNREVMKLTATDVGGSVGGKKWGDWEGKVPVSDRTDVPTLEGGTTGPINPGITNATGAPPEDPGILDTLKALGSAGDNLKKGLLDSFAKNPPIVGLEIYYGSGDKRLKYRFSPLVITGFTINASRETIDGDPVVVTIDVTFDYYQINATNANQAPSQAFAGVPLFNTPRGNTDPPTSVAGGKL